MASYPPFDKFYVVSYAANDRDFPVIGVKKDPRVAGYRIPEDLSPHPDSKRYPNHVFTGAQPSDGDQIVTHIYEILPSPYVPFTRYDDDLGPIQGRRRSVKNEGQVARLGPDQRITYEAREGSAIVYTEIEESWSIETDEDGNSLFPVRDRDFYDASRGPVQERRQLFVPTGEEEGSLENVNGVITQTSYEPYNEFLSFKVVQTYKVDGPQLIGKATNNEGQLTTITTQRKAALGYIPPNPTATRTVEAEREDAESLVERIVDTPKVFEGKTLSLEKPDVAPQKFRANVPSTIVERSIAGTVGSAITLAGSEISKSEQQVTEFVKRVRTEERDPTIEGLVQGEVYTSELGGGTAQVTEKYGASVSISPAYGTVSAEKEALGDGKFATREVELSAPPQLIGQTYDEELDIIFPFTQQFVQPNDGIGEERTEVQPRDILHSLKRNISIDEFREATLQQEWQISDFVNVSLPDRLVSVDVLKTYSKSTGRGLSLAQFANADASAQASASITYSIRPNVINGYSGTVPSTRYVFFLDRNNSTMAEVISRTNASLWPSIRPQPVTITLNGASISHRVKKSQSSSREGRGLSSSGDYDVSLQTSIVNIPATLHGNITFNRIFGTGSPEDENWYTYKLERIGAAPAISESEFPSWWGVELPSPLSVSISAVVGIDSNEIDYYPKSVEATNYAQFPTGNFIVSVDSESYKYGLVRITAIVAHITSEYV
jgi:hypothetical protein